MIINFVIDLQLCLQIVLYRDGYQLVMSATHRTDGAV